MPTLIATELLKLRTVRWPWFLLAVQVGLVALGISGYAVASGENAIDPAPALAHVGLTSLFALVFGLMAIAGEVRDGTITGTYLATPRRAQVLVAKFVVFSAIAFGFAVVTAIVGVAVTAAWMAAKGSALDLADAGVRQTLLGAVLWNTGFAAIGVGVGAMVPGLSAAITGALAWVALVEGLVGQLVGTGIARWLPMAAGQALEGLSTPGRELLSPTGGGLVLAAYAVGLALLAGAVTVRRDVT